jgi:hypothetical protein
MILTNAKNDATLHKARGAETAEEIIGILTAISVVSKSMAKKLALLEQRSAARKDFKAHGKKVPRHAH